MLSSRERLLSIITGDSTDRVPIAPFIHQEFMSDYLNKSDTNRITDACQCADELGIDLLTRDNINATPYFLRKSYPNWEIKTDNKIKDGNHYISTSITTPSRVLQMIKAAPYVKNIQSGIQYQTTRFLINSIEDLEVFSKYLPTDDGDFHRSIIENGRFARNYIDQRGLNAPWASGSVFDLAASFIGVPEMLMNALCDHNYYHQCMSTFTDIAKYEAECYLDSDYDLLSIEANMCSGSLVSGKHFRDYIMPYEDTVCSFLQNNGMPVLFHNCGKARDLLECYSEMSISIYETMAPEPIGDTDIREANMIFNNTEIALMGTFDQVNFLKSASPEAVFDKAAQIMLIGKERGRYIFSASNYIESGTPITNVKALIAGALSEANY